MPYDVRGLSLFKLISCNVMFETTALTLLKEETEKRRIVILCKRLDLMLQNGFKQKIITELCGAPGSGKTQFCLQLCINVQIPVEVGGIGGEALFIDTNQGFDPYRLKEIAENFCQKFKDIFRRQCSRELTIEFLLNKVSFTYCMNYIHLLATIERLREMLALPACNIKLIIIDSFSYLLRSFENNTERTRLIYEMLTELQKLATEFSIVVVITNEITTKLSNGTAKIVPALGESHSHKIGTRIMLCKQKDSTNFIAFVAKRSSVKSLGVPFRR